MEHLLWRFGRSKNPPDFSEKKLPLASELTLLCICVHWMSLKPLKMIYQLDSKKCYLVFTAKIFSGIMKPLS